MNMESLSWTSDTTCTNPSQSTAGTGRFSSWVTFDDDDFYDDDVEPPSYRPSPKPPNVKLDNFGTLPLQDANSNFVSSLQNQKTDGHILDLSPDGPDSVFGLTSPAIKNSFPYSKKNPFLHDDYSNIQPSPINPFSAYFNKTDSSDVASRGSLVSAPSSETSSFFFSSSIIDEKNHSGACKVDLDQFKNLQISDPEESESTWLPDDTVDGEDDDQEMPYKPAHMSTQDGWPMLLRIPEKKNIMSSRHWGPIFVRLSDSGKLKLFYEKGLDKPFKEFQLNAQLELSDHKLQNYEENSRVHSLSLDHVVYKEKRKIQPKVSVVHVPIKEQLVKLGAIDYQDFLSFRHALKEMLAGVLPEVDSSPVTYSEEQVQVEVLDNFYGVVSKGDHRILQQLVTTQVSFLAFLTDTPTCHLGLNDVQVKGKEVVSRHDIIPNTTTRWIRLRDCLLHDCADQTEFNKSRRITFEPPSGRRFQLLRYRTAYAEKTLPFTLRTVVSVRGAEVELQSWLIMSTGFSSNRDLLALIPCENVTIRYPVPEIWAKNFRRESVTGEKSLKARFNKGASFGSVSSSGSEPAMRVTLGTAKLEQAFKSVVWRIGRLPDKNSGKNKNAGVRTKTTM